MPPRPAIFDCDPRIAALAATHWPTEPCYVCREDPKTYRDVVVQWRRSKQWIACEGAELRRDVVSHPLLGKDVPVSSLPMESLVWRRRERQLVWGGEDDHEITATTEYATVPIMYTYDPRPGWLIPRCMAADAR